MEGVESALLESVKAELVTLQRALKRSPVPSPSLEIVFLLAQAPAMASFQPTLKHFILRQEAIHLYRHAVRASKGTLTLIPPFVCPEPSSVIKDPVTRRETLAWMRSEFERNKHITDVVRVSPVSSWACIPIPELCQTLIEDKIRSGRRELRQLFSSIR